ncbi:glycoside hydrolase [Emericellopsis atlantica]|uniref:Glycoside hydrolase n=1 Tax=Emericellopsis atlantica TaxID=2614577 RepID=A0A9P7ZRF2_9HYPO|nr:glycoside hydrolase [Emericellopsis atlantica]KAG9256840.1 glycoside hydrolase [Emericellopsis atlantica]
MAARQVFAHYMVGLTDGQSQDQWSTDISAAKNLGIDGFALNMGPTDPWTLPQLRNAYRAAEAIGGFTLFPSFDMACCGDWGVQAVIDIINEFKVSSAHTVAGDKPMVSTFEGPAWASNWQAVRDATGGIYFVPDWSSLGPDGVSQHLNTIDGHFSWNAWPKPGEKAMSSIEDEAYQATLGAKSYMMGVSPWFYTNLPQWSKNWFMTGDSLWYDRWQQAIDLLPDYVQIITWNDFGESHYIAPVVSQQVVEGADKYVNGFDHSAWQKVLPYFIKAYKEGSRAVAPPSDEAIAWYRESPAKAGSDGGTIWGQSGSLSASDATDDVVNVLTVTIDETDIEVIIGGQGQTFRTGGGNEPAKLWQVPWDGLTGSVGLKMNGREVVGPEILAGVGSLGYTNFNAHVIGLGD